MLTVDSILKDLSAYLVNKGLSNPKIKESNNYELLQQIFLDYINNVDNAEQIHLHISSMDIEQNNVIFQFKESEIILPLIELNGFDSSQLKEFLFKIFSESAYK